MYKGKAWDQELPSDAQVCTVVSHYIHLRSISKMMYQVINLYLNQDFNTFSHVLQIIAHLFCTYLDTHLPSNPRYQHGFTGLHFLKPPCKPSMYTTTCI